MRTIGRTALTGLVWLTAAMTLVAGLPHIDCRCPSGQVKPFCLATASKKTGCCCGGGCCAGAPGGCCCKSHGPSPAGHGQKPPCCGREKAPPKSNPGSDGPQLSHRGGCVKSLAASALLAVGTDKKTAGNGPSTGLATTAYPVALRCPAGGASDSHCRPDRPPAPPPDLVILLQRLVI